MTAEPSIQHKRPRAAVDDVAFDDGAQLVPTVDFDFSNLDPDPGESVQDSIRRAFCRGIIIGMGFTEARTKRAHKIRKAAFAHVASNSNEPVKEIAARLHVSERRVQAEIQRAKGLYKVL